MAQNPNGIYEILRRWRDEIKRKQRPIISFEETAGMTHGESESPLHGLKWKSGPSTTGPV
jgi:hypothetical protein